MPAVHAAADPRKRQPPLPLSGRMPAFLRRGQADSRNGRGPRQGVRRRAIDAPAAASIRRKRFAPRLDFTWPKTGSTMPWRRRYSSFARVGREHPRGDVVEAAAATGRGSLRRSASGATKVSVLISAASTIWPSPTTAWALFRDRLHRRARSARRFT
jgi:hypothetical protein